MKKTLTPKCRNVSLFLLFLLTLGFFNGHVWAQIPASSYGYTAASGTFVEITGSTTIPSLAVDDEISGVIPLGFTFNFCGVDYTQAKACANGWFSFNTATGSDQWTNSFDNLTIEAIKPALMPLWDDLAGWGTGAVASYVTTGTAPNRIFTMEWKNWNWRGTSPPAPAPNLSFQIKLYEGSNLIEYIYRQEPDPGDPGNYGATIGIADGAAVPTYLTLNNATATATVSSTTFTTSIITKPATGQIYRFTPPPPCNTATAPAIAAATAAPATICLSGTVNLGIATPMPAATGFTYQWQRAAVAAGPFTTIANTTTNTYAAAINASSYYRCRVLCNYDSAAPFWVSTASPQVVVNNPGTPTGIPGNRCGPGSVLLGATAPAASPTATLNWYANPTGGAPIGTGTSYSTLFLPTTTNFYVAASAGGFSAPQTLATITTGGNGCTGGVMFDLDPNLAVAVDSFKAMSNATTNGAVVNIYTRTGTYLGNEINAAAWTLFTTVTVNTVAGQMFNIALPTPINITAGNITGIYINYDAAYTSIGGPQTYSNADLDIICGAGLCSAFGGVNANRAFNGSVHYRTAGCEGNRVQVTATINPSPVITKSAPAVVCNNAVATIILTPPTPAYPSYTWTPTAGLYTDPAGTIPYGGGSNTTVYMKTTEVGQQTYFMMAGDPLLTTGCTFADTVKIWSQPGDVTILGQPDTICVSGTTKLSLDTIAGYYPGSIQWGSSGNGSFFVDISGATNPTYTTPTLSFGQNTYYRALIKAGAQVCESPVKYVVIANPTIVNAPDSFHCGPGEVTLTAETGGNGSPVWYENATGGFPIATGSPFVTPFLGTTTSYYLASGGGGSAGVHTLGAGALNNGQQGVTPFSGFWGGSKHQYIIRVAELLAAGIPPGADITSLALDVIDGGNTYPDFAISMMNTTVNALPGGYVAGAAEVKAPATHITTVGINTFNFTSPFTWDGTSNILIQTCWSNGVNTSTGSAVKSDNMTFIATKHGQSDDLSAQDMCAAPVPDFSMNLSERPQFLIGYDNRCESAREEVIAYIHPKPEVNLGQDINKCINEGELVVLDAGVQLNSGVYLWDDNITTSQLRAIGQSGTYSVVVTNQYTCKGYDTINVILRENPVVDLGRDTSVCNGVVLEINAGNDGIEYFWNTGALTQTIEVASAGTYNVFVTNGVACVAADTIMVTMEGELPTIQGINITNDGQFTFHFTAVNPQNAVGIEWNFGDGSADSVSFEWSPMHTYADAGSYLVTVKLSSTCGFMNDTISANIVNVGKLQVGNNELTVFPNPSRGQASIINKGSFKMTRIEVYNVLGQIVYKADAETANKHTLSLNGMASGIYTIQIVTDKGTVARKLEVIN